MKTIIKILILVSLASCTKKYTCTVVTSNGTTTSEVTTTFYGTTQEKNDYEQSGQEFIGSMGMTQTVDCVVD